MQALEMRERTCCFTGHRNLPGDRLEEIADRTRNKIRWLIIQKGVRFFGVGGAVGYDTLVAKVLFQLRQTEFPDIKVILVYPFDGFTARWSQEQKAQYRYLLPLYDKVVCQSEQAGREAYLAGARHLVDGSAYCIAYCTRSQGGAAYTVRYANSCGLTVQNIANMAAGEK